MRSQPITLVLVWVTRELYARSETCPNLKPHVVGDFLRMTKTGTGKSKPMKLRILTVLMVVIVACISVDGGQNAPRHHLNLSLLKGRFVVCRLEPSEQVPQWAFSDKSFCSVTYTRDELSILCRESAVPKDMPKDIKQETGWRLFKVAGPLDFALTGILASMAEPLARAGVSIFAISTYDTDYLMVKEEKLELAQRTLKEAGHSIKPE